MRCLCLTCKFRRNSSVSSRSIGQKMSEMPTYLMLMNFLSNIFRVFNVRRYRPIVQSDIGLLYVCGNSVCLFKLSACISRLRLHAVYKTYAET